ncbi:uncharacterized protein AMSG_09217 [Thecamonas trahens ATCC 50062]|uniref:Sphingomyelin synthase-like domain-containing protein n=1 Tax=Thecamonas trahens ATCC 50062 TaxID=461836 RepID=A0A0L0DMA0_THETB|nr:hypothetical protein AMSG_09217 [Thecamonas trahens ATCC 50062]KNC53141.1 hypothetical protein AMSG_09217 [Thecamonas trahens ATCC 50062]|eukprot:XP_013754615.1 hypothetical protein AMSG_09217 [Thecamonas trahens ATCC 50062]
MAAVDANADGAVDLLIGGSLATAVLVHPANAPVLLDSLPGGIRLHIVGNFRAATAAVDLAFATATPNTVYVALANPSSVALQHAYLPPTAHVVSANPVALTAGQYDSNALVDIVVALDSGDVVVLADGATGATSVLANSLPSIVALHLFATEADGGMLLVSTLTGYVWLSPLGRYPFDAPSAAAAASLGIGDLSGNGAPDIITASPTALALSRGVLVLGAVDFAQPSHLPECGGVPHSLVCISARAAASPTGATVTVAPPPPGHHHPSPCPVDAHHTITRDMTLAGGIILCGSHGSAIFRVASPAHLTLRDMSLETTSTTPASAIVVDLGASLSLTNTSITGFSAHSGAAIAASGTVSADASTFASCTAQQFGGAVALDHGADASFVDSAFVANTVTDAPQSYASGGGAIGVFEAGSLACTHCTFDRNAATGLGAAGGAIAVRAATATTVVITDSTFTSNSAPEGYGGALHVDLASVSATVLVLRSAFTDSSAVFGGTFAAAATGALSHSFPGHVAPVLPPPSSLASLSPSSPIIALANSSIGSSAARYGGIALSCGVVVDLASANLTSAVARYSQAGGVWYQCLPLSATLAVRTASLPATDPIPTSPLAYGPISASPAASLTWSRAGAALVAPSGVGLGDDGGTIVLSDAFGQLVTDNALTLSVGVASSSVAAIDASVSWDPIANGYLLSSAGLQLVGGVWPASVGHSFDLVISLPSGASIALSVTITNCPPGRGASSTDTTRPLVCQLCPDGTESNDASLAPCSAIPTCSGTGFPIDGVCVLCPSNTIRVAATNASASSAPPCVCARGFWNAANAANTPCEACPRGAICPGGTGPSASPYARPGFYRVASGAFAECVVADACIGSSICGPNYAPDSLLCKDCATGAYRQQDGSCKSCPNAASSLIALLAAAVALAAVAAAVCGVLAVRRFSNRASGSGDDQAKSGLRTPHSLSLAIIFLQVLGILARAPLNWPQPPVKQVLEAANVANIDITFFAADCSVPSFAIRYVMAMLFPLVFALILLALLLMARARLRAAQVSIGDVAAWATSSFGPLVYIPLSRAALIFFDCSRYPNGRWYLDAEPSLECFATTWLATLPLALVGVGVYVVALPAFYSVALHKWRHALASPLVQLRYGSLYSVFRHRHYYAGVPVMIKRLLIVVFSVFASNAQSVLFSGLLAVFITSMLLLSKHAPYRYHLLNTIEITLDCCIVALLVGGLLFWIDEFPNTATFVIFVVIVLAVIAFALLTLAIGFLRELHHNATVPSRIQPDLADSDADLLAIVSGRLSKLSSEARSQLLTAIGASVASATDEHSSTTSVALHLEPLPTSRTLAVFACHLCIVYLHSLLLAMNEARPACATTPPLADWIHQPPIPVLASLTAPLYRHIDPDKLLMLMTWVVIAVFVVHPDRFLLLRRLLVLHATLSLIRGVLISLTTLPSPHPGCRGRVVDDSFARAAERAAALTLRIMEIPPQLLGLRYGYEQTCCDLIISGHTCVLSANVMVLDTALSARWLRPVLAGATALIALLLIYPTRHYSIDVIITLYLAASLVFIYITLAAKVRTCVRRGAHCRCGPWIHAALSFLEQPEVFATPPARLRLSLPRQLRL